MRRIIHFNENWVFTKDGTGAKPVTLPHTWNATDGQDGGNDYWRGTATYTKTFSKPELDEGERLFVEFKGVAMTADVTLNGAKLAHHEGGYSTFRADLTDALQYENELVVAVDNGENDRVYPQKADFTFYGGLYREVNLIITENEHFALTKDGTPGIRITPKVDLEKREALVRLEAWAEGGETVRFFIHGKTVTAPVSDGYAAAEILLENVRLWDGLEDPYLYTAEAILLSKGEERDRIAARFGCREFAIDPQKGFFLNGRSYPLRGVSRHQDRAGLGNALSLREHREDMALIREIGANTVRLAHYQHAQEFYDLCDEAGMIVWAEIPYITMHMEKGKENTLTQMRELITQCYNHPSIVCWGLSNEITASGKVTEDLMENHRALNELCHRMDATRPTVMAHAFMLEQESPLIPIADLGSYNLYFGWYLGELEQNEEFFDEYHAKYPDRVIGFSEYGADANPRFQDPHPDRGDYTESYQCVYHEHMLSMIEERPWLWATHVWNMFDFAADGRDEGGKHGVNQKGLVTMDRRLKKDAFYLYKAAWNRREPFVHLVGRRYADRCEERTEVKVYSNQAVVELYVDDVFLERQEGKTVFRFSVPLTGEHRIEARAASCVDAMTIRRVESPNPAYAFLQKGDVVNWFDRESFREDCFSIKDKFGELMAHPEAGPLVGAMMTKIRSSRGDVAKSTAQNANLQKMMAGMRFESMLKQAGKAVTGEEIAALNRKLQKIRK